MACLVSRGEEERTFEAEYFGTAKAEQGLYL